MIYSVTKVKTRSSHHCESKKLGCMKELDLIGVIDNLRMTERNESIGRSTVLITEGGVMDDMC